MKIYKIIHVSSALDVIFNKAGKAERYKQLSNMIIMKKKKTATEKHEHATSEAFADRGTYRNRRFAVVEEDLRRDIDSLQYNWLIDSLQDYGLI